MESEERSPLGRRERRRLEIRARVLEAATALFEERGYDATTVSDICEHSMMPSSGMTRTFIELSSSGWLGLLISTPLHRTEFHPAT